MENNQDNFVTEQKMVEYSEYIKKEIFDIKKQIEETIKTGSAEPEKLNKAYEYYENLHAQYNKLVEYLDYLAESLQVSVAENESLKETTEKLVVHNDYLAEKLEKSIGFSNYIAEKLDNSIQFGDYLSEQLNKSIDFVEYVADHTDKSITYSKYLAEKLDQSISFGEYLSESINNSIDYSEYLAESISKNIKYSEYVAESLDSAIEYSKYIAEHVDNNISYVEYVAENVSHTQAYSKYLAESLDKTIDYSKYIVEKLTAVAGDKINEEIQTADQKIGGLTTDDATKYYDNDDDFSPKTQEEEEEKEEEKEAAGDIEMAQEDVVKTQDELGNAQEEIKKLQDEESTQIEEPVQVQAQIEEPVQEPVQSVEGEILPGMTVKVSLDGKDNTAEVLASNPAQGIVVVKMEETGKVQEVQESCVTIIGDKIIETENQLKNQIAKLVSESKKRKDLEEAKPHFLLFLNEEQKKAYFALTTEDKSKVISVLNENNYSSESEILQLIHKALSAPQKSLTETLIENMPKELLPIWETLEAKVKTSILESAKLYPAVLSGNISKIESFWNTRNLESYSKVKVDKKVITENMSYVSDDTLPDSIMESILSKLSNM